jgi:hypothetical protein
MPLLSPTNEYERSVARVSPSCFVCLHKGFPLSPEEAKSARLRKWARAASRSSQRPETSPQQSSLPTPFPLVPLGRWRDPKAAALPPRSSDSHSRLRPEPRCAIRQTGDRPLGLFRKLPQGCNLSCSLRFSRQKPLFRLQKSKPRSFAAARAIRLKKLRDLMFLRVKPLRARSEVPLPLFEVQGRANVLGMKYPASKHFEESEGRLHQNRWGGNRKEFIRVRHSQTPKKDPKNAKIACCNANLRTLDDFDEIGKHFRIDDLLNNRFWLDDERWLVEQKVRLFRRPSFPTVKCA